jgi:thiamine pyrophosphokinase
MQATILVNGLIHNYALIRPWVERADLRIAADGGLRHFDALGCRPHALVGDLDSVDPAEADALEAAGVTIQRHRPEKDQTDLELAIEFAVEAGAQEILLLGALGGRLDQTLANLLILAQREWPAALSIVEENQMATAMRAGNTLHIEGMPGQVVSLIPLTAEVTGITYTGLKYLLQDATLPFGSTRGVSNELAEPSATIKIETGLALIVREIG